MDTFTDFVTEEDSTSVQSFVDSDTELDLKVMNLEYVEENGRPIVQVFGREEDGTYHHVEVTGHDPSFFVHEDDYDDRVANHYAVKGIEYGHESYDGEALVRIYTYLPTQVRDVRELFDQTWEADIWYTQRFTLDNGIKTGCRIDLSDARDGYYGAEYRVTNDAVSSCEPPEVDPRLCVVDIEVAAEDGVPSHDSPYEPVTTIVAYDTYTEQYTGWLYCETPGQSPTDVEAATEEAELDELRVFHDEQQLLHDFSEFIEQLRPDILSGWYSNDFDFPYLIDRCRELDVWKHKDWSPLGNTYVNSKWGDPVVDGVSMIDMLEAYEKTQIHKLPKKSLDYVANKELDAEKIELEDTHTEMWRQRPVEFLKYNKRDVELTYGIEQSKDIMRLFQRMRDLTGCEFGDFQFNVVMIGMLVLHKAREVGVRLPTAVEPDSDWFHGAVVLDSVPGIHENVVYLDYSSLYPTMMLLCNMSNETIVGDSDELEASPYTEEDCYVSYHDPRLENVKEGQEPEYEPLYFADESHDVGVVDGQGLMASVVNDMIDLKMDYKGMGTYYTAVKQVTNSVFGVVGDQKSFGRGWRLFDWRMAEAITLGGRKMLMHGSETALDWLHENGYTEAKIVLGDSVPSEESIYTKTGPKRACSVAVGDSVWTDEGWSTVNKVIEKPVRKELYTIRTMNGVVHVTEDHSLLRPDGAEVTPKELSVGDEILHNQGPSLQENIEMNEDVAWLFGFFAAEGSCGIYYSEYGQKDGWAINNADRSELRKAKRILEEHFNLLTTIDDTYESSNSYKLALRGDNPLHADVIREWREWFYDGKQKRVPPVVFKANSEAKTSFVQGYHDGDGHNAVKDGFDEMWSKDPVLAQGVVVLLQDLGYSVTLDTRRNHDSEYYRTRCVNYHQGSPTEIRSIDTYETDCSSVYDFETKNGHFQAGIGNIIVHNTDGFGISIPSADSREEAIELAEEAASHVNSELDDFVKEEFNADENIHEIEVESYAERLFIQEGDDGEGTRKKYAEIVTWEDGEEIDDPDLTIKGFGYVRSDRAQVSKDAQKETFEALMNNSAAEAKELVFEWLEEAIEQICNGELDDDIGIPFGIQEPLSSYGSSDSTPQPQFRGARYANQEIYGGEAITRGTKPMYYYIKEGVTGDCRATYDSHTKEDGTYVDAISVFEASDLPDGVGIDYEKMVEKTLRNPLKRIFNTLGWEYDWDRIVERSLPSSYFRDDEQLGLSPADFM